MAPILKRTLVFVTSLLLALGIASAMPASPANAAPDCSAKDQRYGKTLVHAAQASAAKKKSAKKVKKAKRAYAKRHTTLNKSKLKKARQVNRKAIKKARSWQTRKTNARTAATRCHAAPAAPAGPTPTPAPQLPAPVEQLLDTLTGYGLDTTQVQALADQLTGALASGDLSPEALVAVLQPVVDGLTGAGLPADQVLDAVQQVLGIVSSGDLPADENGLVALVLDGLQDVLAGTPLDQLNPILDQVRAALDAVLGGLLGDLTSP